MASNTVTHSHIASAIYRAYHGRNVWGLWKIVSLLSKWVLLCAERNTLSFTINATNTITFEYNVYNFGCIPKRCYWYGFFLFAPLLQSCDYISCVCMRRYHFGSFNVTAMRMKITNNWNCLDWACIACERVARAQYFLVLSLILLFTISCAHFSCFGLWDFWDCRHIWEARWSALLHGSNVVTVDDIELSCCHVLSIAM